MPQIKKRKNQNKRTQSLPIIRNLSATNEALNMNKTKNEFNVSEKLSLTDPIENINTSTPKRMKNLLSNLKCTLNSKYTTSKHDSSKRSYESRSSSSIINISSSAENTPKSKSMTKQHSFVSPIHKLLKKNGSSTPINESLGASVFMDEVNIMSGKQQNMEIKKLDREDENVDIIKHEVNNNTTENVIENKKELNVEILTNSQSLESINDVAKSEKHELNIDLDKKTKLDIKLEIKSPSPVSVDSAQGTSVSDDHCISFKTGDLCWGQIYKFSYWPCMICPDPDGNKFKTESGRNGETHIEIHVRFFADNGRRNWVKSENLMHFEGLQKYLAYYNDIKNIYGVKSAKYNFFMPKKTRHQIWMRAVNEAQMVSHCIQEQRLNKFYAIYESNREQQMQERKRRQTTVSTDINSDFGSLQDFGENDIIIQKPAIGSEDVLERSSSPISPEFSPLLVTKRRKISTDSANATIIKELGSPVKQVEKRNRENFEAFYLAMKDYILNDFENKELKDCFTRCIGSLWSVKRMCATYKDKSGFDINVSELNNSGKSLQRLSDRLRNIQKTQQLPLHLPQNKNNNDIVTITDVQQNEKVPKRIQLKRPIEEIIDDIFNLDNKYLFKGMTRDPICKYCYKTDSNLIRCSKNCASWLHIACKGKEVATKKRKGRTPRLNNFKKNNESIENNELQSTSLNEINNTKILSYSTHITAETEPIICEECATNDKPKCFACNHSELKNDINKTGESDELIACNIPHCWRQFHLSCIRYWPQSKITKSQNKIESFRCPSHSCHMCISDDPKAKFQHIRNDKLVKCIKCPACYHFDSTCIPAGSQILTAAQIICPRHNVAKVDRNVNVNWCFVCVGGGQVVCCETCPTAVHEACLNMHLNSNDSYICEDCESGRMPLYGEMVWAKFNTYRWWPAIILPPTEIPHNILKKPHAPNEFVVRFFGTNDHGWISRRRVYLFMEGDCSEPPKVKSNLDQRYTHGVAEAKRIYELVKLKKQKQTLSKENRDKLQPQPYIRIKQNRAVLPVKLSINLEKVNKCECSPNDIDPCGPESNCLNRVLYNECNTKVCPTGENCRNQMFEMRISPRLDVRYLRERGFGLICLDAISANSFIIEYVGEVINDAEFQQRMQQKSNDRDENFYFLSVEKDYIIDAGPRGNLARFMNHSCDPNCETQKWSVNGLNRIGLFAIKDIPPNTELTFNYHWDELLSSEKKKCFCAASNCVGQIGGKKEDRKEILELENIQKTQHKKRGRKRKFPIKFKPLKRLKKQMMEKTDKNINKNNSKKQTITRNENLISKKIEVLKQNNLFLT